MDLTQISRTAILTLICRASASGKNPAEFSDPMAELCVEQLVSSASGEDRRWLMREKRMYGNIQAHDAIAGTRRSKVFDEAANRFIAAHPKCTLINLACGFDTRFWRIDHEKCTYIDLDLPEVIRIKKEILREHLCYELIGCSVTDTSWIDTVTGNGNTDFLLLAEGLFAWLPRADATRLFKEIGARFARSQFVLDLLPEKYTQGLWKIFQRLDARISWGLDAAWVPGIHTPQEIEACGKGIKVIGAEKGSAGPVVTVEINAV